MRSGGTPAPQGPTTADMMQKANESLEQGDFAAARRMFRDAHEMRRPDQPWTANDDYVVQQVAYATLMSRAPGVVEPLEEARHLLEGVRARASQDPATVELWGGISKALWDETHERDQMEDAVAAYARTFCLRGDYESGITLAFLLNARAALSAPAEAIADFVQARRVRRQVADRCEKVLGAERPEPPGLSEAERETVRKGKYRVRAALAEAHLGLGNRAEAERWRAQAFSLGVPDGWKASTVEQLSTLSTLLEASPLRFLAGTPDTDS
jgi:tetratricopeptide (TPR) repeat protein